MEQLGDQSSAWQDIDALVCSAVFAREYLPHRVWVEVKQSKVKAPHPGSLGLQCQQGKLQAAGPAQSRWRLFEPSFVPLGEILSSWNVAVLHVGELFLPVLSCSK